MAISASGSKSTADYALDRLVHSIWQTLRVMFGLLAIVVGADKFTDFVTDWSKYLNPIFLRIIPVSARAFMLGVGVIEIIVGIIVFAKPRVGGIILTAWFFIIALQLVAMGQYLDIAVRDIVIGIGGTLTLARLSRSVHVT